MKKNIIVFLIAICFIANVKAQEKTEFYAGVGLGILFMTNGDVSKIYPAIDVDGGMFLSEINPFIGAQLSKSVAIEFSPSFTIQKTYSKPGYYFNNGTNNYYYLPQNIRLITIPLIAKVKYYPFAKNDPNGALSGIFTSVGAGGAYLAESYDFFIYTDANRTTQITNSNTTTSNNIFVPLTQVSLGYEFPSKYSIGAEVGYRIVPLNLNRASPVVSSWASNFNNVFFDIKFKYAF